eukprot:scaffold11736_cov121-Isochrysis_galbana.AAC.2
MKFGVAARDRSRILDTHACRALPRSGVKSVWSSRRRRFSSCIVGKPWPRDSGQGRGPGLSCRSSWSDSSALSSCSGDSGRPAAAGEERLRAAAELPSLLVRGRASRRSRWSSRRLSRRLPRNSRSWRRLRRRSSESEWSGCELTASEAVSKPCPGCSDSLERDRERGPEPDGG